MSRRGFIEAAGAAIGGAVVGCGRAGTPDDELVFALASAPTHLDPRFAQDAFSDRIARLIFSTLLVRRNGASPAPHLAERLTHDARTWTATLRDARFHDGTPVTAHDVAATFRSILDPTVGSVRRLALEPLREVVAVDERTVRFELDRPHAPFPQTLSAVGIAPAWSLTHHGLDFRDHLVGSGAFRFLEQRADEHVLLERNDDWFAGRAGVARLRFKVIPDATVRVLEVLHGSADLTQNDLPPHVLVRLREEPELAVETSESTLVKYLAFNLRRPPLNDRRVRAAIAHSIDREAIVTHKLRRTATTADTFLHPDHWAFESEVTRYPHDPARARRLLDEAGLTPGRDGVRFRLVYRTSTDARAVSVARILKRGLSDVGIDMELRSNEWGVFFSDIKQGRYDLFTLSAVGVNDPDWYAYVLDSRRMPPNGANRTFYADPEVDRLIDAGRSDPDPSQRAPVYRSLQRITTKALPLLPLWYSHNVVVRRTNVVGYTAAPDGDFQALTRVRKQR